MILRPQQIRMLAAGLPATPANRSSDNASSSSTSNSYADKRNAVQNGIGTSGDGNTTSYTSYSTTTDQGAVMAGNATAQLASLVAGNVALNGEAYAAQTAANANNDMSVVSQSTLNTSSHLADVGLSMLQANTSLANSLTSQALTAGTTGLTANTALAASLTNGTNNLATSLFGTIGGLYRDAGAQESNAVQIASDLAKTQVAAQNDNRYLIAAGLAVVCIVGVVAFTKGK